MNVYWYFVYLSISRLPYTLLIVHQPSDGHGTLLDPYDESTVLGTMFLVLCFGTDRSRYTVLFRIRLLYDSSGICITQLR